MLCGAAQKVTTKALKNSGNITLLKQMRDLRVQTKEPIVKL
jgi:hypothetical protein